jgi:hypothetical protein
MGSLIKLGCLAESSSLPGAPLSPSILIALTSGISEMSKTQPAFSNDSHYSSWISSISILTSQYAVLRFLRRKITHLPP